MREAGSLKSIKCCCAVLVFLEKSLSEAPITFCYRFSNHPQACCRGRSSPRVQCRRQGTQKGEEPGLNAKLAAREPLPFDAPESARAACLLRERMRWGSVRIGNRNSHQGLLPSAERQEDEARRLVAQDNTGRC